MPERQVKPTLRAEPTPKKRKLADLALFVAPASTPNDLATFMRFPITDLTNSVSCGTLESKDLIFAKMQEELEDREEAEVGMLVSRDGGRDVTVDSDERLMHAVEILAARVATTSNDRELLLLRSNA